MDSPYFVLVTGINQEQLARRRLKDQGFEVYFPVGKKIVKHARRQEERIFPVFSRYIFVKCHEAWGAMRDADGVLDILKNNWQPMEVPAWIIEDIKSREAKGDFDILPPVKSKKPRWSKSFEILKNLLDPDAMLKI